MSKYNRTYHLNFSPGSSNDDKISDSVDSLLGIETVITEKIDGGNIGMNNIGVFERSHAEYTSAAWTREVRLLHKIKVEGLLEEGSYIFGEGVEAIHSIEYSNLKSCFYIFGVREKTTWLSWDEVEEYSYLLDIPTVPVLFRGIINTEKELKTIVERLVKETSALGGQREGIVIRTADGFDDANFADNVMKWVRANHVTTTKHWSRNWKKAKLNIR